MMQGRFPMGAALLLTAHFRNQPHLHAGRSVPTAAKRRTVSPFSAAGKGGETMRVKVRSV